MSKRYRTISWHGESRSLFYVVDTDAEDIEILETYASRDRAEADAARRNEEEYHERGSDHSQAC